MLFNLNKTEKVLNMEKQIAQSNTNKLYTKQDNNIYNVKNVHMKQKK